MQKTFLLIACFCMLYTVAKADPDNLQAKLDAAPSDSARVHVLIDAADSLEGIDYTRAEALALRANELARAIGYYKGEGSSFLQLARFNLQMGDDKKALEYSFKVAHLCEKYTMPKGLSNAYKLISAVYQGEKGTLPLALEYLNKALEIDQRTDNQSGKYMSYFRMQQVLSLMGRKKEALDYGYRAMKIGGNDLEIATLYINMGITYKDLKQYDTALKYAEMALAYFSRNTVKDVEAEIYRLKAMVYIGQKKYPEAEKNIQLAISNYESAGSKLELTAFFAEIAQMYKEKGEYAQALSWMERERALKDSLTSSESSRQMAEMETKYQSELKERKIQEQRRKIVERDLVLYIIIGLTFLLLAIAVITYWNMRKVRRLNKELVELHKVKNKLFSIISHDLRSPLNTLQNLLTLFRETDLSKEKIESFTGKLQRAVQSTSQLLDNLLHWASAQMNAIRPVPTAINMRLMTDEAFELLQSEAEQKKVVLENKVDMATEVFADKDMLRVVLRNLLSNSLKFTQEGGYVAVMNQAAKGQVQITVKDNGVGMSEEIRRSLFQAGTPRESSLGTANEKGFGIGLQLCQEYIEKNGGSISVESDPGQGSSFSFTLESARPD